MDFARSLIAREHVDVAPRSAFGELGEGYVRLSLASSREDLLEGTSRLLRFVRFPIEMRRTNTDSHCMGGTEPG
jgi:aminotransferase